MLDFESVSSHQARAVVSGKWGPCGSAGFTRPAGSTRTTPSTGRCPNRIGIHSRGGEPSATIAPGSPGAPPRPGVDGCTAACPCSAAFRNQAKADAVGGYDVPWRAPGGCFGEAVRIIRDGATNPPRALRRGQPTRFRFGSQRLGSGFRGPPGACSTRRRLVAASVVPDTGVAVTHQFSDSIRPPEPWPALPDPRPLFQPGASRPCSPVRPRRGGRRWPASPGRRCRRWESSREKRSG